MNKKMKLSREKINSVLFWTIFPAISFFGLAFLIQFFMVFVVQFFDKSSKIISSSIFNAIYTVLFFGAFALAIYFLPQLILKMKFSKSELGVSKKLTWLDIGLAIAGFIATMILSGIALQMLLYFFPSFNINQSQNIGFGGLVRGYEYAVAFICITIIPAFAEEFIFRGVIYGQLRKISPFFAVFWTSLLFGLAHIQLNIAVVTFIMSIVMCFIRERFTHSIWSGVILHFLKNGIAFCVLFFL